MTDRLISAEALMQRLRGGGKNEYKLEDLACIILLEQPAYDIGAKCDELREASYKTSEWNNETQKRDLVMVELFDALNIVRKGGVVAENATSEHKCENCTDRESCDYYHYSGEDWKEDIGTECDEWKGGGTNDND